LPFSGYERYDYQAEFGSKSYFGTNSGPNPKYRYEAHGPEEEDNLLISRTATLEGAYGLVTELSEGINLVALQQKAFANILPNLDGLTSLMELPKTINMILGFRKRAIGLLSQAFRAKKPIKSMASAYLEWRYGWRTLGFEIQSFNEFWKAPKRGLIIDATATRSVQREYQTAVDRARLYCSYTMKATSFVTLDVKVHAAARFSGQTQNVLASLPITAWELIPASFVADWAFSVGDALAAWQVLLSSEEQVSSVGYSLSERSNSYRASPTLGTGTKSIAPYGTSGSAKSQGNLKTRSPLGRVSLIPQNRLKFDILKAADLAALMYQLGDLGNRVHRL
jgi:hypothetical protein